jgi:hypothetical protein
MGIVRGIIVSKSQFNSLNKRAVDYLLKNGAILNRWCTETIHPGDKRLVFRVTEKIESILTKSEKVSVIKLTEDWFPVEEL